MTLAIPSLMVGLAVLDLAFAGFRAAAGRDGRIVKRRYYARALVVGAAAGVLLSGVMGVVTWLLLRRSAAPGALFAELVGIGGRMALVFGAFGVLVVGALVVYALSSHEVRTFATVAILGPFTLARPAVIAVAALVGALHAQTAAAMALTLVSCAGVLATSATLDRLFAAPRGDG